jgi:hypothetical protein
MTARCIPFHQPSAIYFVLTDLGGDLGKVWPEREPSRMSRATTIADIRGKQIEGTVLQIIEMEFGCPGISSRDVTEEIKAEAGECRSPSHREFMGKFDQAIAELDHARDLRKHEVLA